METISDLEAFNRLFAEYKERFIRFTYSYVRDSAVAEDITIEAFLYYWENRSSLSPESNVPAYILTTIKHKSLNYLEHIRTREIAMEHIMEHAEWELRTRIATLEACQPNELFNTEMQEIISKTLDSMPELSRRIFIMSRYQNKSQKEIAETCHIIAKTVEFHITKVLKMLRRHLKDYIR
jgi:RNA polymerase sigma-70 factor (ECF subfamily)